MKSAAKSVWICLLVLGLIFTPITSAFAQTYTATVTGTVTDPQGAAIAGVKVVATNQGTKLEYTAQTGASGVYTVPFLPVGVYMLTVESTGFKKLVSNEIKLEINQTARIDLQLQVGGVNEVVNVQDVATVLQTESVTVGNVISGSTTTNLPLNGRNFQQLALLLPGAVTPNPGGFNSVSLQNGQGRPYVNGQREQGNSFLLDGVSVDETIDNRIGYKPNVDAIAEFRVETSNSSAEFGNVAGGIVNATLKSGTNEFHGNVFEFFRNDALDANTFANNRNGAKKQKLRQNVFGGTLGGPIVKNRLFFFTDYQGTLQRTGGGATANVAPVAWRTGDLSSLTTPIIDPLTGKQFPGNIIPTSRIVNPVAKALFADPSLYPLPSRLDPSTGVGIYNTTTLSKIDGNQFDVKIDARLTEKDNVSARYSFANFEEGTSQGTLPTNPTGGSFNRPQGIALNWTRTFSPTIVNEARVGVNRAVFITNTIDWANIGNANATLGIPGGQALPGLSLIALGNGLTSIGNRVVTEDSVTNTFHYGDNLTILRGRHSFKMGGQLQRYQQNRFYTGNNGLLGGFTYDGTFTGDGKVTGSAFADFLLDLMANKSIGNTGGVNPGTWGHRQNRIGIFFQDDFKLRNNLTLNLGLRWEYTSPVVEVNDRQSNFELFTGRLIFAGQDGASRALYDPYYKGFEPRIGIAWTPEKFNNRLVVRAGYGIVQFMEGTGANLRLPLNPPFFSEADRTYNTAGGAGTITNGFSDVIAPNQIAGLIRVWDPNLRPQFTQQYNLTLEYQLANTMSVSAAYVGNRATHLVAPTDFNQPLPGTGDFNLRRPLSGVLPRVTQISGTASWAISNYNGLQLNLRQRFGRGAEFLASYTLSKTLTDNLGYYGSAGVAAQSAYSYNQYAQRLYNYGPAFFDARHNFMFSGSYELPFGKGRSYGNNLAPLVNNILGGWNLNSIVQFRSGFPITVTTGGTNSGQNPRGGEKPNLIGDPTPSNQSLDNWINAAAFANAAPGTFGNSPVGVIRAPGFANWDFGVGKKFYVTEGDYFDFRAEFFNFTNHPSFAPPGRTFSDTNTFGRITGVVSPPRTMQFALKYHF
jgi:carboxypeptidase family protein/TonB-dependent receptor-like protein